ncbi:proliferation-associated protein A-like isoform X1 [Planococcus citri]|uniref:proliferation-associated protein A-like isoform X1 n=1 Tax=Planococcus citri TaxID=170843 RepID=UPI0031F7C940
MENDRETKMRRDKYLMASRIANEVLNSALSKCIHGALISKICSEADSTIVKKAASVYKREKIGRGIVVPTNIVVDVGSSESHPDHVLENGNVVKIMITRISCISPPECNTCLLTPNLLCALHSASDAVITLFQPGRCINDIFDAVDKTVRCLGCSPGEQIIIYKLDKMKMKGCKMMLPNMDPDSDDDFTVQKNTVYLIDLIARKEGSYDEARLKFEIMVLPSGNIKTLNAPTDSDRKCYKPELYPENEELKKILANLVIVNSKEKSSTESSKEVLLLLVESLLKKMESHISSLETNRKIDNKKLNRKLKSLEDLLEANEIINELIWRPMQ